MKIKKRHILIAASACILTFIVKMCEVEDFSIIKEKEQEEIHNISNLKNKSDSLFREVIKEIEIEKITYHQEIDSLNNIILNDNLTVEDVEKLKRQIRRAERLLEDTRNDEDLIFIDAGITVIETVKDSVVYNIIREDSIVWNIIEKDMIILRDTIIYNIKDSVVNRTIYEIDTIHYDSEDVKKIKLK